MPTCQRNESARTSVWLDHAIRDSENALSEKWKRFVAARMANQSHLIWAEAWPHDYWVAQTSKAQFGGDLAQHWRHEGALDEWPLFQSEWISSRICEFSTMTNASGLDDLIAASSAAPFDHQRALESFFSFDRKSNSFRDKSMQTGDVARAWLTTIVGKSFSDLLLSPTENEELIAHGVALRIKAACQHSGSSGNPEIDEMMSIEALYTAAWTGTSVSYPPTAQGQSQEWRNFWLWLSNADCPLVIRDAIHTAARLLVSPPLLAGLERVISEDDDISVAMALCTLRRWTLGLRAMSWLEHALSHRWAVVRPQDLVSFAFAALAPWWPRPIVAISHRSCDVKAVLTKLDLWNSAKVAIDASTIPVRETNTGMIWRLFAATPVNVRVLSPKYAESLWCQRESELIQYLVDVSDFLRGRVVADAKMADLTKIDVAVSQDTQKKHMVRSGREHSRPQFPPAALVLNVPTYPPLIINLLAAVGSLRLLNALLDDVDLVNRIAHSLSQGISPKLPAPTNDPAGWGRHIEIFQALNLYGDDENSPARLTMDYSESDREIDLVEIVHALPSLSTDQPNLIDVVSALEWNREMRDWFTNRLNTRQIVLDCRTINKAEWNNEISHAIQRGILEIRADISPFIVQNAIQKVEYWQRMIKPDIPIMTQHVPDQMRWLTLVEMAPTWIALYLSFPGLEFHTKLHNACFSALSDEFARSKNLTLPTTYGDVLTIRDVSDTPFGKY